MPLDKSCKKSAIGKNIKTEMASGRRHDQAVAIALNTARKACQDAGKKSVVGPKKK